MARPKKNNADYFSHDAGMRNDTKIRALRKKFGCEGYAIWCMLLELLTSQNGFVYKWDELNIELAAGDFDVETKRLMEIVEYMKLLELVRIESQIIYSKNHIERFAGLLAKRKRDNFLYESKKETETAEIGVSASENPSKITVSVNGSTQSIVKQSIEEKVSKKKIFSPPSLSDIQTYFVVKITEKSIGLNPAIEAQKFQAFYDSKNWMIGKNKMVNWKSAAAGWILKSKPTNGTHLSELLPATGLMR